MTMKWIKNATAVERSMTSSSEAASARHWLINWHYQSRQIDRKKAGCNSYPTARDQRAATAQPDTPLREAIKILLQTLCPLKRYIQHTLMHPIGCFISFLPPLDLNQTIGWGPALWWPWKQVKENKRTSGFRQRRCSLTPCPALKICLLAVQILLGRHEWPTSVAYFFCH